MRHVVPPCCSTLERVTNRIVPSKPESLNHGVRRHASNSERDVDLLVEFAPGEKSSDNFIAVSFLMEDELGRSVELLTPKALSPHPGPNIVKRSDYVEIGD